MYRPLQTLRVSLLPLAASAAVLGVGVLAATTQMVSQRGRAFSTQAVQIARGDTVRFNNEDEFTHQIYVNAPGMTFESDEQPPGETVNVRFPTSGTFEVHCHIHPKMLLSVTVR